MSLTNPGHHTVPTSFDVFSADMGTNTKSPKVNSENKNKYSISMIELYTSVLATLNLHPNLIKRISFTITCCFNHELN